MEIIERLIDLVENTKPKCVVVVNIGYTYEDDEGQDVEYACDVTLYWGNRDYQMTVTAPLCRIGIPDEGKGYNIDTLYWGESIQRVHNGLVMTEYSLPLKQPLRVTV